MLRPPASSTGRSLRTPRAFPGRGDRPGTARRHPRHHQGAHVRLGPGDPARHGPPARLTPPASDGGCRAALRVVTTVSSLDAEQLTWQRMVTIAVSGTITVSKREPSPTSTRRRA